MLISCIAGALCVICCETGLATNTPISVETAIVKTQQDVDQAVRALIDTRKRVSYERIPLTSELAELNAKATGKRLEAKRLENLRLQTDAEQTLLKKEVAGLSEELAFIRAAVSEHRRSMTARASLPEMQFLREQLNVFDQHAASEEFAQALNVLLETTEKWNAARLGGYSFQGACLDQSGREHIGKFLVFGPAAYFSSKTGDVTGPVSAKAGSLLPAVHERISDNAKKQILTLAEGKPAVVPVDVTGGTAMQAGTAGKTIMENIKDGGIVMIPILLIGALSAILAILKILWLTRRRGMETGAMEKITGLLVAGKTQEAGEYAALLKPPLGRVLSEGVIHRNAPKEQREEIMSETLLSCLPEMERHLGTLAVFGAVAPLLGLLGTVTGMIHTFRLVTIFGTGDARQLSGGISEALVTTVAGLLVAIPVLLAHAFLSRAVKKMAGKIESAIIKFNASI